MFANPIGLFALLGIPIVLGLHLFRRRSRTRPVSALFLWKDQEESTVAGLQREQLRTSASLWLELLAALFFALVLAGPRACNGENAAHLVVVIDGSASMGAHRGSENSTKERVRNLIADRIEDMGAGTRVTLIASGRYPRILAGPADRAPHALEALAAFSPVAPQHEFEPTLALAYEFSERNGVLFVTDELPQKPPFDWVELCAVGQPEDNAGIVRAARTRNASNDDDREQISLALQAFSSRSVTRTILVEDGVRELVRREISLSPDLPKHLEIPLPKGCGLVRVRFEEADSLGIDDSVSLAPEPARVLRLATTLHPKVAWQLGLANRNGSINRLNAALPNSRTVDKLQEADLIISDAPVPDSEAWILQLHTSSLTDSAPDLADKRRDYVGPFLSERRHPLLQGTTFEGIVWSVDPQVVLPGAPLVTIGDLPILTEEFSGDRRLIHVNLDPAHSTLPRSPDWAILLSNLAEMRRASLPGPESVNLSAGEEFLFRGAPAGDYVLRDENGRERKVLATGNLLRIEDIQAPGLYQVLPNDPASIGQKDEALTRFCVQFQDPGESDLRDCGSGNQGMAQVLAELPSVASPFETLAGCLIVLLLLADWRILGPGGSRQRESLHSQEGSHEGLQLEFNGGEAQH